MDLVAGNVLTDGFTAVWDDSRVFTDLRDAANLKGKCGSCEFSELCGGCRCRAYAATGDHLSEDPACLYEPGTLEAPEVQDVAFSDPVIQRIDRIPIAFIREKVRRGLVAYASSHNLAVVTSSDMDAAIAGSGRALPGWAKS
jgi:radical SAM protein with 4Fe4S-binding SPASM domain